MFERNTKMIKNGYFDKEKNEFVITNMYPIRPLLNYLWNEETVASCDQFGKKYRNSAPQY